MRDWDLLRNNCQVGAQIDTTLLGRVPCFRNALGELQGVIPGEVQQAARAHGFMVVSADFKRDSYTLKRIK